MLPISQLDLNPMSTVNLYFVLHSSEEGLSFCWLSANHHENLTQRKLIVTSCVLLIGNKGRKMMRQREHHPRRPITQNHKRMNAFSLDHNSQG
jgi:hypothetical protein